MPQAHPIDGATIAEVAAARTVLTQADNSLKELESHHGVLVVDGHVGAVLVRLEVAHDEDLRHIGLCVQIRQAR